jgi:hypothetical protein
VTSTSATAASRDDQRKLINPRTSHPKIGEGYLRSRRLDNVICPGSRRTDRHVDAVIRAMKVGAAVSYRR